MKNDKLGILKSACSNLQRLKLYERRYKCALVKSAAIRLRIKLAKRSDERHYMFEDQTAGEQARILRRIDWGGLWKTPIGRWLRTIFERESHKKDLVKFLLQPEYVGHPKKIREYLANVYGMTDRAQQDDIVRRVTKAYAEIKGETASDKGKQDSMDENIRADAEKEYFEGLSDYDKNFYAEHGFLPERARQHRPRDTRPLHRRYRDSNDFHRALYDRAGIPYSTSDYLTDSQMYYDRGFSRDLDRAYGQPDGPGTTHNHYYFGVPSSDGKPIKPVLESSMPSIDGVKLDLSGFTTGSPSSGEKKEEAKEELPALPGLPPEEGSGEPAKTEEEPTVHPGAASLLTLANDTEKDWPLISRGAKWLAPWVDTGESYAETAGKVWDNPFVQGLASITGFGESKDNASY